MSRRPSIAPGDVPAADAARRMGTTLEAFNEKLPGLIARGFPRPDPDTGNFDLEAIDAWRHSRHPHLFGTVQTFAARDASTDFDDRLAAMRGARR